MTNLLIVASAAQDEDLAEMGPFHLQPREFVLNPLAKLPFARRVLLTPAQTSCGDLASAIGASMSEAGSDVTLALVLCPLVNATPQAERPEFLFTYGGDTIPLDSLLPAFNPAPGGSLFLVLDGLAEVAPAKVPDSKQQPSSAEREQQLFATLRRFPGRALGDILFNQKVLNPACSTIVASAFGEFRISNAETGGHPLRQSVHPIHQPSDLSGWWKDVPYYVPDTADHGALTRIVLNGLLSGSAAGALGATSGYELPYVAEKRDRLETTRAKDEEVPRSTMVIRRRRNVRLADLHHYVVSTLMKESGNRVKIVGTTSGRNPKDFERELFPAPHGEGSESVAQPVS